MLNSPFQFDTASGPRSYLSREGTKADISLEMAEFIRLFPKIDITLEQELNYIDLLIPADAIENLTRHPFSSSIPKGYLSPFSEIWFELPVIAGVSLEFSERLCRLSDQIR